MIDIEALKPLIVERLKPLNPNKIILFGSYAYGTPTEDTAISVKHLTKIYKPIDRLKESLHPLKKQYHKDFYALNDVSFELKKMVKAL